jgi:hypothetical protein
MLALDIGRVKKMPNNPSDKQGGEFFTEKDFEAKNAAGWLMPFQVASIANKKLAPLLSAMEEAKEIIEAYDYWDNSENGNTAAKKWLSKYDALLSEMRGGDND